MPASPVPRPGPKNAFTRWFGRMGDFDLTKIFARPYKNPYPREVLVNVPVPPEAFTTGPKVPVPGFSRKIKDDKGEVVRKEPRGLGTKVVPAAGWTFVSNQVLTSKYNIFTFLPRNLLEQFRRVANLFFLALVILQFFPRFTTVSPGLAALPLIVVLFITALKDGYEDLKRHQSDRAINNIKVIALRGTFHNPNVTLPKSRSFGVPKFIRNWFYRQKLVREAKAEEREAEHGELPQRKGFWGKRLLRKPGGRKALKQEAEEKKQQPNEKLAADQGLPGGGPNNEDGLADVEAPQIAPGGGTMQAARARSATVGTKSSGKGDGKGGRSRSGTVSKAGAGYEAPMPERHARLEGDYYADDAEDVEVVSGPTDTPGKPRVELQPGSSTRNPPLPHAPTLGGNKYSRPTWVKENWEDLRVGDFVRLHGDESVPADLIVCATSEDENVCYVETKNLDGETNLKSRSAVPELTHLRTSSAIANDAHFTIRAEPPDVNMFTYNAAVEMHDGQLGKDGKPLKCPVNMNTMLLRGTVVRNTEWVIGVVCMTGNDTKIVMNSGNTPSKRSKVERLMNPMVFLNLFLLALMTIMCAVVDHFLEKSQYPEGAYWLYGDNQPNDNPSINGVITWANALIAFQNIVPISLYISIEFTRLVQAAYIWGDDDMKGNHRRTTARSWNLSDDLGQIEYIFSDKTGTLTQNAMIFRQCSIAGKIYMGDEQTTDSEGSNGYPADKPTSSASSSEGESSTRNSPTDAKVGEMSEDGPKVKLSEQVLAQFHDSQIEADLSKRDSEQARGIYNFFMNLALCHTVLTSEEDGMIAYKAQSPDEAALVQAAADVGFIFLGRDKDVLRVQTPHDDDVVEFQLLNVLEFNSARKRMSVVLRKISEGPGQDDLVLLTKGADNIIFERLAASSGELKQQTDKHLEDFANMGLRTLCLAWKPLDEEAYEDWERRYHDATTLIEHREEEIERVSDELERDLNLLGATAIEDRLQDGVPEAIADLKRAGIKIWVATGDKLETAIAIAKSCNLLSRDMNLIVVKGGAYGEPKSAYSQLRTALERFFDGEGLAEQLEHQPPDADLHRHPSRLSTSGRRLSHTLQRTVSGVSAMSDIVGEDNGERLGGYGLVIDGASLRHAFAEPYTKDLLLELSWRCRAVVCCRTSPLQKALIVRLVKDGLGSMCLAIGDGANDVSMIQAADIGVGVAGEEGLQAVNSSDYAMGQFRFLKRLLLVHGQWSYLRNSNMIVNFFYKEIIGVGVLFWFQFYCGYSATTVYEYTYLLFWNVFWTLVPVIFIGIFDRHVGERPLMAVPELYETGRLGKRFGLVRFCIYMLDGIYQSVVVFFFLYYAYDTTTARQDGYDVGMYEFSTVMAVAAVLAANFYNGMNTHAWNWWVLAGVLIGPVLIICYSAVYAAFKPTTIWTDVWGNNHYLWPAVYWWLGNVFTILLCLAPRYFYRFVKESYFPDDADILRAIEKKDKQHDWAHDPNMPQPLEERGQFEPAAAPTPDSASAAAPIITPSPADPGAFPLGRVRTEQSLTHDLSTGRSRVGTGTRYGFDEGVQLDVTRYTSRGSERYNAQRPRPRKSLLHPFSRTPEKKRERSGTLTSRLVPSRLRSTTRGRQAAETPAPEEGDAEAAPAAPASGLVPPLAETDDHRPVAPDVETPGPEDGSIRKST